VPLVARSPNAIRPSTIPALPARKIGGPESSVAREAELLREQDELEYEAGLNPGNRSIELPTRRRKPSPDNKKALRRARRRACF
jgi:hypothetical protein